MRPHNAFVPPLCGPHLTFFFFPSYFFLLQPFIYLITSDKLFYQSFEMMCILNN